MPCLLTRLVRRRFPAALAGVGGALRRTLRGTVLLMQRAYAAMTLVTALAGLVSSSRPRCLNLHTLLLSLLLMTQVSLATLFLADETLREAPPGGDATGAAAQVWHYVHSHAHLSRILIAVTIGVQLATLAAASAASPDGDIDRPTEARVADVPAADEEGLSVVYTRRRAPPAASGRGGAAGLQEPLLSRREAEAGDDGASAWEQRMRERYNLDTSQLAYQVQSGRRRAAGGDGGGGTACVCT